MGKLLLIGLSLLLTFCNGTRKTSGQQGEALDTQQEMKTQTGQQMQIKQGIQGQVLWEAGNQMPSPDAPISSGRRGVERTVYVYELTHSSQTTSKDGVFHTAIQTKLVAQVKADANGNFAIALAPGRYSLFTKEESGLFANLFDGQMNIFPVTVNEGEVTTVEFLVNYNASY
ncbi:carboxypeptidase regulatory-like domain-containing protein [Pontibacter sp. JH31]|uniref:Carboxypeptidase regulatory-like domain-containing protein n=1 Tax=Pontibacter aquaedesilientis TaxID=2766980 RepID=A0ABR7XL00_9BACT|nr:carboxypeptidase regulatory-like domain-containing protein [Pontibacter aquaedesilientis]MBD1398937.1 carboxypeptidase regulatory-like domain-containing protein [Pontibacter aquaedesilientis]